MTATDRPTYFDPVQHAAAHRPNALAFRFIRDGEQSDWSYGRFWSSIQATASHLETLGLQRGDITLIFGQHGPGLLLAFLGCQLAGATPAFMPSPTARQDGRLWADTHRELCTRLRPTLVFADSGGAPFVRELGLQSLILLEDLENLPLADHRGPLVHGGSLDDVAFLQHSSGTTGLKKGVTVSYRQLAAQVTAYSTTMRLTSDHHVVSWLPIYHDMGLVAATLLPFSLAIPVTWIDTMTWLAAPQIFMDELAAQPRSVAWMPNFAFSYLAQRCRKPVPERALAGVHAIINCSETCKPADMDRFRAKFRAYGLPDEAVQVCYAMAEYVFAVTQTSLDASPRVLSVNAEAFLAEGQVRDGASGASLELSSVGVAIPGVRLRLATEGESDVGEIEIAGDSLCSGYYGNDEATREKFVDGWYRSGDLGFLHEGELFIAGRKDDRIIVRGRNLYAHDIEATVTATGQVRAGRCVAIGVDDDAGTQQLVVIAERSDATGHGAAQTISERVLELFGVSPKEVLIVDPDTLVKTSSGKISRSQNAGRFRAGQLTRWAPAASESVS